MTYLAKPKFHHPDLPKNALGYTHRDYEGTVSTLCAGCGHDSITASIIQACFELAIEPHRVAKISGIGCSSKTPTYFLGNSHGFNSVHGRMPSVLTGANLANRDLIYLGVSGDGDSASIGLGQFAHCLRRGVNMIYIVENNGVYGLTKGQFSATADRGSKSKRGMMNTDNSIDLVAMALQLGATLRRPLLLRRQAAAGADHHRGDRAQGRGLHRRDLARASPSTTTPARPRASISCASTTRRSTGSISCRAACRSRSNTSPARSRWWSSTTARGWRCASSPPTTTCTTASPRSAFCSTTPPRGRSSPACSMSRRSRRPARASAHGGAAAQRARRKGAVPGPGGARQDQRQLAVRSALPAAGHGRARSGERWIRRRARREAAAAAGRARPAHIDCGRRSWRHTSAGRPASNNASRLAREVGRGRHADTDGQARPERRSRMRDGRPVHGGDQPGRHGARAGLADLRQQADEFLAAIAGDQVARAARRSRSAVRRRWRRQASPSWWPQRSL